MLRVIIAGSRDLGERSLLDRALAECSWVGEIGTVLCGCARGIDRLGEQWAKDRSLPVEHFPPKWDQYGKEAGRIRNQEMVDKSDALVAVMLRRGTPGTQHVIQRSRLANHRVYIYLVTPAFDG